MEVSCCNTLLHNTNKFHSILSQTFKLHFVARTCWIIGISVFVKNNFSEDAIFEGKFLSTIFIKQKLCIKTCDRNAVIWLVNIASMPDIPCQKIVLSVIVLFLDPIQSEVEKHHLILKIDGRWSKEKGCKNKWIKPFPCIIYHSLRMFAKYLG